MDELKPCPFCGNEPLNQSTGETWCSNPDCLMNKNIDLDNPPYQQIWNNRPTEAAATAAERARVLALVDVYNADMRAMGEDIISAKLRAAIESGEQPPEAK